MVTLTVWELIIIVEGADSMIGCEAVDREYGTCKEDFVFLHKEVTLLTY